MENIALRRERLEQAPQLVDVRQLRELHQVRLAGDHDPGVPCDVSLTICCATRIASSMSWLEPLTGFLRRARCRRVCARGPAAELLVQKTRCAAQLVGRVVAIELPIPGRPHDSMTSTRSWRSFNPIWLAMQQRPRYADEAREVRGSTTAPDAAATSALGHAPGRRSGDAAARRRFHPRFRRCRAAAANRRRNGSPCRSARLAEVCGELTKPSS